MAKYPSDNLFSQYEDPEDLQGRVIQVAFDTGADSVFDYLLADPFGDIEAGQRVKVPFGRSNKLVDGFCVGAATGTPAKKARAFRLKRVKQVIDKAPLLDGQLIDLARWISGYYVCPLGQVLAAMVPAAVKKGAGVKKEKRIYLAGLSEEQLTQTTTSKKQQAIVAILQQAGAIDPGSAIEKADLLDQAGCTAVPLKTLMKKDVVRVSERQAFRSLPAIPPNLADKITDVVLNDDQNDALSQINEKIGTDAFGVTVLYGVTDSGKTEVYIRAIQEAIGRGKTAIVLLPEIALIAQTVQRFSQRFKRIAVMHSYLSAPERNAQWQTIKSGQADVVIGARSAIFAPLQRLGLIVVDEEHEPSYKQDKVPRYNGRDVAIKRAQLAGAHCILGSATPSLETLANCRTKKHYQMAKLPRRVMDLPMPEMRLVDMACETHRTGGNHVNLISRQLQKHLTTVLGRGEQAILLLNRRGYSNFVFCPTCGHSLRCRNCDVTLTFHKRRGDFNRKDTVIGRHISGGYAICHYCLAKTLVPQQCPLCKKAMTMIGLGSQRLEEQLQEKLPGARIKRVDSDSMAGGGQAYYRLLRDFGDGKIDILAGTQMLAKGLHFPNVTLVGIISADTSLSLPDFRANERTFQLISQVAGRAGRSEKSGIVIVQTLLPKSPAVQFALKGDYPGFVEAELAHRRECNLPPYWRMAIVGMRDTKHDKLTAACEAMRARIDEIVQQRGLNINVRGPMPATISRVQQFHRMQIILQAPDAGVLSGFFSQLRVASPIRPAVQIAIDVDPINLL